MVRKDLGRQGGAAIDVSPCHITTYGNSEKLFIFCKFVTRRVTPMDDNISNKGEKKMTRKEQIKAAIFCLIAFVLGCIVAGV